MLMSHLTSAAFATQAANNPVILLPLGSQEDHGPHLPMGDYLLAAALAEKIATACAALGTPVLVAPTLPFGVADYFGASPGGLAISAAVFKPLLAELLAGLRRHGGNRIVILNGHGGNAPVIHQVTLAIKNQHGAIIPTYYLWKIARILMERLAPADAARFGHGAEPLLSLTAALRPGAVNLAAKTPPADHKLLGLPVTGFGTIDFAGLPIDVPAEFDQMPPDTINHAAPLTSATHGNAVADALVAHAAQFITHFATCKEALLF